MNRHPLYSLSLFFFSLFLVMACATREKGELPPHVEGEIVVKYQKEVDEDARVDFLRKFNLSVIAHFGDFKIDLLKFDENTSVKEMIEKVKKDSRVLYAEPNYIYELYSTTPNDLSDYQWYLHNVGQTGGRTDADIDAPEGWDYAHDSPVVVAVVDSGVDYTHPDLADNIWVNSGEVPNNGVDDDGNGYVDDVIGWDFYENDNDPMDDVFHGTHVAGIIGAVGNNGQGITGVNWSVKIMPVRFIGYYGGGDVNAAVKAIKYAVDNGADIINASWGGPGYSTAIRDAIYYAYQHGVLFVTAAGNDGRNSDYISNYPNNYDVPNILSVAATTDRDTLASFSNFGASTVDVAAPGEQIYSTLPSGRYGAEDGTSMAAPVVSGMAALALALNPNLSVSELKEAIMDTVDVLNSLRNKCVSGGRVNLYNLLSYVSGGSSGGGSSGSSGGSSGSSGGSSGGGSSGGGSGSGGGSSGGDTGDEWITVNESVSTPHNYPNNYSGYKEFYQPGALEIRIHFINFSTEQDYDICYIYDSANNVVAQYSGHLGDFYSDPVPGDYAKVVFVSDYSVTDYGFDIDFWQYKAASTTAQTYQASTSISSPHPYSNYYDNTWEISQPGAVAIRVHFSNFETENGYDYVYIYDGNGDVVAAYTGSKGSFTSAWVQGDKLYVRLVSDYSVTAYGFDIDYYEYQE